MQYILSEEEYHALRSAKDERIRINREKLQTLCTEIANKMPVVWGWGGDDPKPWGCILTSEGEWYCDKCPVRDLCPMPGKNYSQ